MGNETLTIIAFIVLIAVMIILYLLSLLKGEKEKNAALREEKIERKFDELTKHIESIQLTAKDKELLLQIEKGLSYKEIADEFNRSTETIKKQISSLHKKFNVSKTAELIKYGMALKGK